MPAGTGGVNTGVGIMTPGQARIALLSFLARDDRRGCECAVPADQIWRRHQGGDRAPGGASDRRPRTQVERGHAHRPLQTRPAPGRGRGAAAAHRPLRPGLVQARRPPAGAAGRRRHRDHQRHPARAQVPRLWPARRRWRHGARHARRHHGLRVRPRARAHRRGQRGAAEAHPARCIGRHRACRPSAK